MAIYLDESRLASCIVRWAREGLATFAVLISVVGCARTSNQPAVPAVPPAVLSAPATANHPPMSNLEDTYEEVLSASDVTFDDAFEKLKAELPQFEGDFITEGDLLRTEEQLRHDVEALRRDRLLRASGHTPQVAIGPELVAALRPNGASDLWPEGNRTLTYSIDPKSFKDPKQAALVEQHIKEAVADWEAICTAGQKCGLSFVFRPDTKPTHKTNTFIVRRVNANGAFIAAAFFPSYPSARRFVNIDPSFFTTAYDKTGVLRHEVGHVLGYRHEHIRDILGCRQEGTHWLPITPYDAHSVMHYMCGGGGTLSLRLTDIDKQGHVKAYGGE